MPPLGHGHRFDAPQTRRADRDEDRVDRKQDNEKQARPDARDEQLRHAFLGDEAIDDHRDRRRDENAERAARRYEAVDEVARIIALDHFRDRDRADGGGAGNGRARDRGKQRATQDRRDREAARPMPDPRLHRGEQVLADTALEQDIRHHQEHRH